MLYVNITGWRKAGDYERRKDKTVLITDGGTGIGMVVVRHMAAEGARIVGR